MTAQCPQCFRFAGAGHACPPPSPARHCQDCGIDPRELASKSPRHKWLTRGRCWPCYMRARHHGFRPKCPHCDGAGYLLAERMA